jgi:ATP-dependent helicase/nuclease subunit B
MDLLLQQIAEFMQEQPTGTRWILLPTTAAGHTLGERLAREGFAWANLRFTTPLDLATRIAAPVLGARGVREMDPGLGPALLLQLLLDLPAEVPQYFRKIMDQPGVAEALWMAVRDFRLAGLSCANLPAEAFTSRDKHDELVSLLEAYERELMRTGLADDAIVFREASEAPCKLPVTAASEVLELPGCCLSALERSFVDGLPWRVRALRVGGLPGATPPARWRWLNPTVEMIGTPAGVASDAARLAWIVQPAAAPPPLRDDTVTLFRAAGREAEVEEVLRRLQCDSMRLDSVEILCVQPTEYAPVLWEKAARYGIPTTIETGIPGTLTRPVRAALALCGWIEGGFPAVRLARMFESGLLSPGETVGVSSSAAARLLRQSAATAGRNSYSSALVNLAAAAEKRSEDPDRDDDLRQSDRQRAARARAIGLWISTLLATIPEASPDGTVLLGDLLSGVGEAVENFSSVGGPEDAAARSAVVSALSQLLPLSGMRRPLSFQLALVRARIESVVVLAERPRPGSLHVSTLAGQSYSGRPVTFILGLEESAVFPAGLEDPVLLDSERIKIASGRLCTSSEALDDAVYSRVRRIADLTGRVTLSYSCRDFRNGRETYPSWLIFHACRLMRTGADLSHDELITFLGDPATLVAGMREQATSEVGWWLSSLRGLGDIALPAVRAAYDGIRHAHRADTARQAAQFTKYDGLVVHAGADLDPRRPASIQSASGLEGFAGCPFGYYLKKGLGLDAPEEDDPNPDQWLDPLSRGDLLHRIYSAFLRALRSEERRPAEADWSVLWAIAEDRLEPFRREMPPPSEAVYKAEMEQLERDLRLFLKLEVARRDVDTVAVEVPFGFGEADPDEPLSRADPVLIQIGNSQQIRVRGRIDRIDRQRDGSYEVIDYKTGVFWRPHFRTEFDRGTLLQHAIYAEAARNILGTRTRVAQSSYYFCTEKGWGEWVRKPGQLDAKPVLTAIAEAMGAGAFIRGADGFGCRHCDYRRACPEAEIEAALSKTDDSNPGVAALKRLAEYE